MPQGIVTFISFEDSTVTMHIATLDDKISDLKSKLENINIDTFHAASSGETKMEEKLQDLSNVVVQTGILKQVLYLELLIQDEFRFKPKQFNSTSDPQVFYLFKSFSLHF